MSFFNNPYVLIHIAVFLWGFTAILGKLISLDSFNLVWHRMLIASVAYLIFNRVGAKLKSMSKKSILQLGGIGCLIALHWLAFYGSIKIYNSASLTLACMGTAALFSALIEPIIVGKKLRYSELAIGVFSFIGIYLVCMANPSKGDITMTSNYNWAIIVGLIAAFLASLFTSLNKKYAGEYDTAVVSFIEIFSGWIFISFFIPWMYFDKQFVWIPNSSDIIYLLIMGLACTNFTFNISLKALKQISAFTANLSVNLEPVYGFVLAAFIFKEHEVLNIYFYLGAGIILLSVLIHPIIEHFQKKSI